MYSTAKVVVEIIPAKNKIPIQPNISIRFIIRRKNLILIEVYAKVWVKSKEFSLKTQSEVRSCLDLLFQIYSKARVGKLPYLATTHAL